MEELDDINEIDLTKITDSIFGATIEEQNYNYAVPLENDTVHEDNLEINEEVVTVVEENIENPTEEVNTVVSKDSEYFKIANFLIESGQLEDFDVEIEGQAPVKLSEFKDLNKETLSSIISEAKNRQKESLTQDTLSIKGLNDTQLKLINIIKSGNMQEIQDIFTKNDVEEPWKGYDTTNIQHQKVAYHWYLTNQLGLSDEEAKELVSVAEKNLTLDSKANTFVEKHKEVYKNSLANKEAELKAKREEEIKKAREFSKTLTDGLKSMELKPEKVSQIVKMATTRDSENKTAVDRLYEEFISNPEKAKDLILYLTDTELFYNNIESKARFQEKIENAKKIKLSVASKSSKDSNTNLNSGSEKEPTLNDTLNDIFNFK